ncbi:MAG: Panacea domain-containing protein [Planctomycetota bacterium]
MSFHREKLKGAILFIASHSSVRELGLTKLYKLLYFADVAHLREHGETITGSEYIKYEHGPVPSRGEKCLRQLKRDRALETEKIQFGGYEMIEIRPLRSAEESHLNPDEIETLQSICRALGGETAKALSDLSHREPAWLVAERLEKLSPELMLYGAEEDPDGL